MSTITISLTTAKTWTPGEARMQLTAGQGANLLGLGFPLSGSIGGKTFIATALNGDILTTSSQSSGKASYAPGSVVLFPVTGQFVSGVGTVTSITASAPLTGGTITSSGSIGLGTTGLTITQHAGAIITDVPAAGAVTCDFSTGDKHAVTMAVSTTFTLTNPTTGQVVSLSIIQGGAGTLTPTFSPTLDFGVNGPPTWSTVVGKEDIIVLAWNGTKYRASTFGTGF